MWQSFAPQHVRSPRRHGLAVARISFDKANIPADDNQQFKNVVLDRLRAIPGVEAAADSRTNLRVGGGGEGGQLKEDYPTAW